MGLFDMFKSDNSQTITPHFAFATGLLYMMSADGEMDNEEIGHLLSVLGGAKSSSGAIGVGAQNKQLLDRAINYRQKNSLDQYLADVTPILTDAQKMCILMNLLDSAFSDGEAEPEEQAMFAKIQAAFGISDERFKPFFEVLMIKNDRSVFVDQNHPHNQAGYTVQLS
ncbi:TerB family tellurite resistance protein [Chitinibacter sp. FCG-7]|uniref:TerB family tellurite resistance protein n=1 Tax=Chitinibacter mangrovi TaxID=3153927 RepID=A0AAU7F715_9NEIS|nr:TerB family tellurite resistance protein [Chitinibacter sp. GC72]